MKIATATLKSASPMSHSRYHDEPKMDRELPEDYEKRTWRSRLHTDKEGRVYIPAGMFKGAIAEAAKYLSIKVPGKRNATWTKHFDAGVMVLADLKLPLMAAEIQPEPLFLNADGKRGGGKRVKRLMPLIPEWSGTVEYHVCDDTITEDAFREHLIASGQFIGLGRWRPRNGGTYGRYMVEDVKWVEA